MPENRHRGLHIFFPAASLLAIHAGLDIFPSYVMILMALENSFYQEMK
jgi:hypothetical protein